MKRGWIGRLAWAVYVLVCTSLLLATGCNPGVSEVIERKEKELAAKRQLGAAADRVRTSGHITIRLHDAQITETGQWVRPKEGRAFLLLDVSFENTGGEEVTIGSRHLRLADAAGTTYPKILYGGTKPAPDSTLAPGESTRGEIAYDVPKDISGLTWFVEGGDGADEVAFELGSQEPRPSAAP